MVGDLDLCSGTTKGLDGIMSDEMMLREPDVSNVCTCAVAVLTGVFMLGDLDFLVACNGDDECFCNVETLADLESCFI